MGRIAVDGQVLDSYLITVATKATKRSHMLSSQLTKQAQHWIRTKAHAFMDCLLTYAWSKITATSHRDASWNRIQIDQGFVCFPGSRAVPEALSTSMFGDGIH